MVNHEVPTDKRTADAQKRQVNVCEPLVADAQAAAVRLDDITSSRKIRLQS